jgi:hypothetical protein
MNWEAIGAVAELAAAIAVVVSLVYVAIQVKGNSELLSRAVQSSRTQSAQAINENFDRWRNMILDGNHAELWIRGVNDLDSLERFERFQFNLLASALIWSCWYHYQMQRNEGLTADVNEHLWQDLFKHPGFSEWLGEHQKFLAEDFREFLGDVREAVGEERYEPGVASSLTSGSY